MNLPDKNRKIFLFCFFVFIFIINKSNAEETADKKLRNPFQPVVTTRKAEEKGTEALPANEDYEIDRIKENEEAINNELGKVEITAILGNAKGYLVLFKGYTDIFKENDYFNKDKRIKIDKIDRDFVNLTAEMNDGKSITRKILFKME